MDFRHFLQRLFKAGPVWAVLDAARDDAVLEAVRNSGLEQRCLYSGRLDPEIAAIAPYLVKLEPDSSLVSNAWGNAWGVFLVAPGSMDEVRRHCRRFLKVLTEPGKRVLFR